MTAFTADVESWLTTVPISENVDTLLNLFTEGLGKILDTHAPIMEKTVTERQRVPWFDTSVHKLKCEKRKQKEDGY